jgi:VWFA-related protein
LTGIFLITLTGFSMATLAQGSNTPPAHSAASAQQTTPPASQPAAPQQNNPPPTQAPAPAQQNDSPAGQTEPQGNSAAQQGAPADNDNGTFVFKKEVEEVVLHASVVDNKDHMILDLGRDAFSVYENDKPQPITSFRREDIPVAMGIVIDNSGSMREKRDKVNKAALDLVMSSNPEDQVFVVNFNDEYYLDQDFTGNVNLLRQALEKVEARGGTALYDAVVASAEQLKLAKLQKKVIFVVTDGEDNASRSTLEQAVRWLQVENGPTVYAIGLLGGEEGGRRAKRALETLALRTGGIAFLPRTVDQVDEISRTVAHDIRSQYTIGYKPTTPKSVGGYRTIRVDAHAKGYNKLTVRTRSGYYAGQSPAPGGAD